MIAAASRLPPNLITQLEIQRAAPDHRPLRLSAVLSRAQESVTGLAQSRGVTVSLVPTHEWVVGDEDALVDALGLLLSNAVQAAQRGSPVTVTPVEREDSVELRIGIRSSIQAGGARTPHRNPPWGSEASDLRRARLAPLGPVLVALMGQGAAGAELGRGPGQGELWLQLPLAATLLHDPFLEHPVPRASAREDVRQPRLAALDLVSTEGAP